MRSCSGATKTVRNKGFHNQQLPQPHTEAKKMGRFRCGASPSGVATTVRNQGFRGQKAAPKLHRRREQGSGPTCGADPERSDDAGVD